MASRSPNLIPLNSGAYSARSKIGNFQISENIFPEINPEETDPDVAVSHYPRAGERPLSAPPVPGTGRGLFTLSNGALFGVVGAALYYIDPNWVWNLLGPITNLQTPVSMSDNGITGVLVDGSPNGYTITLASNGIVFAPLVDPTGLFIGSTRVDYADTFLIFNAPGTNMWYVSLNDQVVFNALAQANKDSSPDPIQTFACSIRQVWLLGTKNSEVWYNAGNSPFPYQEWPNVFIQYGCAAVYSLVRADVDLFWISQNDQGAAIAVKTNGYGVVAISNRGLEYEWSTYQTVSDCIGGTFQQGGHTFILFHFPGADKTWVYDLATKQWFRWTWTDHNGIAHRARSSFYAAVDPSGGYPKTIVAQDHATGQIYALDEQFYTDNGKPIVFRRSFPHVLKSLNELTPAAFVADFETGGITGVGDQATALGGPPTVFMRCSKNGGASFGNYRPKQFASSGKYRSMMRWRGLGMGRDLVFELMWSYAGSSALQGAYVDVVEHSA
jgi:hypothetical protein